MQAKTKARTGVELLFSVIVKPDVNATNINATAYVKFESGATTGCDSECDS